LWIRDDTRFRHDVNYDRSDFIRNFNDYHTFVNVNVNVNVEQRRTRQGDRPLYGYRNR
jgi:predicted GNAT superfamily acetyltransferase